MIKRKEIKYISVDEMNKILKYAKKYRRLIEGSYDPSKDFNITAFYQDNRVEFILSIKIDKGIEYHTRKDCEDYIKPITGGDAYRILSQYYKIPVITGLDENLSARPFMYYNKKYERQRVYAYCYDLNSAYSWAMLQDIPDTTKEVGKNRYVKANELGFYEDIRRLSDGTDVVDLVLAEPGEYADIIFEAMPSPFKRFVTNWYKKKVTANTKKDKAKAKAVLNYCIGFLQRRNPYLRSTIISRCNKFIKSLMDENTLYCNTDSLVSLKRREDIEKTLGTDVGEWKIEHEGNFAYIGFDYQWDLNKPSYRGVPNSWFPEDYDILKDGVPEFGNVYKFNKETFQIEMEDYNNG